MARPTDFNETYLQAARDYLKNWSTEHGHTIPSVVGFCVTIERSTSTVYDWADNQSAEFSDILDKIVQLQHFVLLNNGLSGDFNPAITKLVLGKHGYHDKQDTEITGKDGAPVAFAFNGVQSDGRRT